MKNHKVKLNPLYFVIKKIITITKILVIIMQKKLNKINLFHYSKIKIKIYQRMKNKI